MLTLAPTEAVREPVEGLAEPGFRQEASGLENPTREGLPGAHPGRARRVDPDGRARNEEERVLGVSNAATFVAAAFVLPAPVEAVDGGYVSGDLRDDRYRAWFHWPSYG